MAQGCDQVLWLHGENLQISEVRIYYNVLRSLCILKTNTHILSVSKVCPLHQYSQTPHLLSAQVGSMNIFMVMKSEQGFTKLVTPSLRCGTVGCH